MKFKNQNQKTYPANEAIWMPLGIQSRDVVLHNSTVATVALGSEHLEVVGFAVWFAITFMEAILSKLLTALSAEEVLGVPGLVQSSDAFLKIESLVSNSSLKIHKTHIQNSAIAVVTTRTEQAVVISFAVWESIAFEEVPGSELLATMIASEMLWMPGFTQSGNDLTDNWLLASIAASLLNSVYSLTTHVCL